MRSINFPRLTCSAAMILAGLFLFALPAMANEEPTPVLGSDGTIYQLVSSTYGDLFGDEGSVNGGIHHVLALDLLQPNGDTERLLVPGTEDFYTESSATLVYEDTAGIVYVLWEGFQYGIHPKIYLTGYDGSDWRDVIEIGASPFGRKSSPQLVVTQDRLEDPESALGWRNRTVLNVSWFEEKVQGSTKIYAPLILEDGVYVGLTDVISLPSLSGGEGDFPRVSDGIGNTLTLQRGLNTQSTVAGFLEPATGDLVVLGLEVLPAALLDLAEKARLQIINLGAKDDVEELANAAYNAILELETDFHFTSVLWFAETIRDMILGSGELPTQAVVEFLAGKARLQIINLGASLKAHGLKGSQSSQILWVRGEEDESIGHFIDVREVWRFKAPQVGGEARLFLSESGERVLVAWEKAGRIYYVESGAEGWSKRNYITLGDHIDSHAAYRILELRVRKQ